MQGFQVPAELTANRRRQLQQSLAAEQLDLLLITNPVNVSYLTGFSGESSYLVLTKKRAILVSDGRFVQQLAEECPGLETCIRTMHQTLPQATAQVLSNLGGRSVGFESASLTVAEWEKLRELTKTLDWKGSPERVEQLRQIKDEWEVAQIRQAVAIAEQAFTTWRHQIRENDTEKELCDALEAHVRRAGGQGSSFPAIVAVGERSALAHAPPTGRTVGQADFLLVDWGASGRFYKSDLTRVLLTHNNSKFSTGATAVLSRAAGKRGSEARLKEIHAVVLRAQQQAIAAIQPGVEAKAVDAIARQVITKAGFGDCFGHGLGHGIGLQVHEAPTLRPTSNAVLEAGMVVTVEPGIYISGWGGVRIEDDVLVTSDGSQLLSTLSRDLLFTCGA